MTSTRAKSDLYACEIIRSGQVTANALFTDFPNGMVESEAKGGVEDPEFEVLEDEGAVRWISSPGERNARNRP